MVKKLLEGFMKRKFQDTNQTELKKLQSKKMINYMLSGKIRIILLIAQFNKRM